MVQHVDFSSSPGKDPPFSPFVPFVPFVPLVPSGLCTPLVRGSMSGYSAWTLIPNLVDKRVKLKNEKKKFNLLTNNQKF